MSVLRKNTPYKDSCMPIQDIHRLINYDLQHMEQLLQKELKSNIPLINQLCQYILHNGGKRLRAILVLLFGKAVNLDVKKNIQLAMIIETIHTATLLHDDVIDMSTMRRGKPSAHIKWTNTKAILSGGLFICNFL